MQIFKKFFACCTKHATGNTTFPFFEGISERTFSQERRLDYSSHLRSRNLRCADGLFCQPWSDGNSLGRPRLKMRCLRRARKLRRVTFVTSDKSHQKRPLKPMVSTLPSRGFASLILPLAATRIGRCITSGSKPALSHTSLCAAALPLFGR